MDDQQYESLPEELDILLVISRRAAQFVEQHGTEEERRVNEPEKIFARLCLELFCSLGRFIEDGKFRGYLQSISQLKGEERLAAIYSSVYNFYDRHHEFALFSLTVLHKWVLVEEGIDLLPLERELELYITTFEALSTPTPAE